MTDRAIWDSQKKKSFIKFNVSAEFKEIIYRVAAEQGVNISAYLRQHAYDFVEQYNRPNDNKQQPII